MRQKDRDRRELIIRQQASVLLKWIGERFKKSGAKLTYTRDTLLLIAIAFPATIVAAQVGIATYKRLTDAQFRRLLIAMLMLSGVILLIREALT